MGKAVFLHRADSIYDDAPDVRYEFPRTYLKAVREAVGDWIVYYEPVKAGPRGYFAVAQVQDVIDSPSGNGMYWAIMVPGSYLAFDRSVPRLIGGRPLEAALTGADGRPKSGGAQQLAVRRLPDDDFVHIVDLGLPEDLEEQEAHRYDPAPARPRGFALHDQEPFETGPGSARRVVERLTRRPYRDVAFRRKVREAYGHRCAVSGLTLRNDGGRPEVQAAHIVPVEEGGSDSVRNGLALSGTLHWMFDRGLISVDETSHVMISHNKVPGDVVSRLIAPDRRLYLPKDTRLHPHRDNLRWHREHVFGRGDPM